MRLEYIPQRLFWEHISNGWKTVPIIGWNPRDWAVLMQAPAKEEAAPRLREGVST